MNLGAVMSLLTVIVALASRFDAVPAVNALLAVVAVSAEVALTAV